LKNDVFLNIYIGVFLKAAKEVHLDVKQELAMLDCIEKFFEEMSWQEAVDYFNSNIF